MHVCIWITVLYNWPRASTWLTGFCFCPPLLLVQGGSLQGSRVSLTICPCRLDECVALYVCVCVYVCECIVTAHFPLCELFLLWKMRGGKREGKWQTLGRAHLRLNTYLRGSSHSIYLSRVHVGQPEGTFVCNVCVCLCVCLCVKGWRHLFDHSLSLLGWLLLVNIPLTLQKQSAERRKRLQSPLIWCLYIF